MILGANLVEFNSCSDSIKSYGIRLFVRPSECHWLWWPLQHPEVSFRPPTHSVCVSTRLVDSLSEL